MTLRRYAPIAPSRGTVIPTDVRIRVRARDRYCVCDRAGFPVDVQARCRANYTEPEMDHVRGSGGLGMKSPSTADNLVLLGGWCHRWKTDHGREARPLLLAYLERVTGSDHGHVDPVAGCLDCIAVFG
jgi:hypothetical protein